MYDKRDVDRLMTDDNHACAYLRHVSGNPEKAMDTIDTSFKFRKEMGIWGMITDLLFVASYRKVPLVITTVYVLNVGQYNKEK